MADFEVVPASERPTGGRSGKPSALSLALEKGETVFLPGQDSHSETVASLRGRHSYLFRRGFKIVSRSGERGGHRGLFVWAERNGTE